MDIRQNKIQLLTKNSQNIFFSGSSKLNLIEQVNKFYLVNQFLPDRNPFYLCLFTTLSEPKLKSFNKFNQEKKKRILISFQYKTTQEKSAKSFFLCRLNRRLESNLQSIFFHFPHLYCFFLFSIFIYLLSITQICNKREKSVLQNNINSKKKEQKDLQDF